MYFISKHVSMKMFYYCDNSKGWMNDICCRWDDIELFVMKIIKHNEEGGQCKSYFLGRLIVFNKLELH